MFDVSAEFLSFLEQAEVGLFHVDKPFDVTYDALMAVQTAQKNLIDLMLEQRYTQLCRPFYNSNFEGPL